MYYWFSQKGPQNHRTQITNKDNFKLKMHHLFPTSSHREYVRCFNSSDWLTSMSWTTLQSIAQKIKSSVQTLNSHTEFPGSHMKVIFCQVFFFLNKGRSYCNISFLDVSIFSVHTSLFTLDADFKAIGTEETSKEFLGQHPGRRRHHLLSGYHASSTPLLSNKRPASDL